MCACCHRIDFRASLTWQRSWRFYLQYLASSRVNEQDTSTGVHFSSMQAAAAQLFALFSAQVQQAAAHSSTFLQEAGGDFVPKLLSVTVQVPLTWEDFLRTLPEGLPQPNERASKKRELSGAFRILTHMKRYIATTNYKESRFHKCVTNFSIT